MNTVAECRGLKTESEGDLFFMVMSFSPEYSIHERKDLSFPQRILPLRETCFRTAGNIVSPLRTVETQLVPHAALSLRWCDACPS